MRMMQINTCINLPCIAGYSAKERYSIVRNVLYISVGLEDAAMVNKLNVVLRSKRQRAHSKETWELAKFNLLDVSVMMTARTRVDVIVTTATRTKRGLSMAKKSTK